MPEVQAPPPLYLVTPQPQADDDVFVQGLRDSLAAWPKGALLVQLRAHGLDARRWQALARRVLACCRERNACLLLGTGAWTWSEASNALRELGADGLHLPSRMLARAGEGARALPAGAWLGASCHDARELELASRLGARVATLSPVRPTASHPGAAAIGWDGLRALCALADPGGPAVYALGGLTAADLGRARAAGAHGVAAIRGLWLGRAPAA